MSQVRLRKSIIVFIAALGPVVISACGAARPPSRPPIAASASASASSSGAPIDSANNLSALLAPPDANNRLICSLEKNVCTTRAITAKVFEQLEQVPNYKSIHLVLEAPSQQDLASLQTLPWLQRLTIRGATRCDDLSPLSALVQLRELNISSAAITTLRPLKSLIRLERLTLGSLVQLRDSDLQAISELGFLKELSLRSISGVTSLAGIESLRNLTSLTLSQLSVTTIDLLRELNSLTELSLEDFSPDLQLLPQLKLRSLVLHDLGANTTSLSPISECVALEQLRISRIKLPIPSLAGLTRLKRLSLQDCATLDTSTLGLPTTLKAVNLMGARVTKLDSLMGSIESQQLDELWVTAGVNKRVVENLLARRSSLRVLVDGRPALNSDCSSKTCELFADPQTPQIKWPGP